MKGYAQAQPNIALVKYWGKRPTGDNVPATPSLSITLSSLWTRTEVAFEDALDADQLTLNGMQDTAQRARVSRCLDDFRRLAATGVYARVTSENNFPTSAGLASSASGFAALAVAAAAALKLDLAPQKLSRLARRSSASAARSICGGFVELDITDADPAAVTLAASAAWPLDVHVVITSTAAKHVGSTEGMKRSANTSDFYKSWVDSAPHDFVNARSAILKQDFEMLADISESSCLKMHAVMQSTRPPLVYWTGPTVETIHVVRELRTGGVPAFFTIDAGPQIKVVTTPGHSQAVLQALHTIPGVVDIMSSTLGDGARVIEPE